MKRSFLLLLALFFLSASLPAVAQKYFAKTIQFKGTQGYTDQELMAAADLKKGVSLTYADMNEHAKLLLDLGIFSKVTFTFDGEALAFSLEQASSLYPLLLENLPLIPGKDLDAKLNERVPLYHGKVPADGTLLSNVRAALEGMLSEQGIQTTLTVTPVTDLKLQKTTAMSMAITTPAVQLGEIHLDLAPGVPDPKSDPKVQEILTRLTGSSYATEGTPNLIETNLGNYYRDKGYLEVEIHAQPQGSLVISPEVIRMPFHVSVVPGAVYKVSRIQLAPGLVVSQADFDRQSGIHPGDIADGLHVRENWMYLVREYHNKGYMKAGVHPIPSFDRTQGTVSFAVAVEPGPVYNMGTLTIQNVSDDLRAAMLAAWKMPPGAVFNEGAIRGFFATYGVNPALERVFATVNFTYVMNVKDEARTVDLVLRLEKKR